MEENAIDKFGAFFIQNFFDKGIERYFALTEGQLKSPSIAQLIEQLTPEQFLLMEKLLREVLVTASHDFLFALQERIDFENDIRLLVDEVEIAKESDGLQGELFTEDGWIQKFSKFYYSDNSDSTQ